MAISQTLTAYSGTDPDESTQTQGEFNNAADAWAAWVVGLPAEINTWRSEANTLETDVLASASGASTAQESAEGQAAFAGAWSDLTGSYTAPLTVYYDGQFWLSRANIADITAHEPGSDATWEVVGVKAVIEDFAASGTWTKRYGATLVLVELLGGGQGGARGSTNAQGGGGGSYLQRFVLASDLGATEAVTIGAGSAGSTTLGAHPAAGGNTTFADYAAYGGGYHGDGTGGGFALSPYEQGGPGEAGQDADENAAAYSTAGGGMGCYTAANGGRSALGGAGGGGFAANGDGTDGGGAGDVSWAAAGGSGGTSGSINGGNGPNAPGRMNGSGGGGGYGADSASVGGNGGPGAGGGGGRAAGGDGGGGYARITTIF